MKMPERDSIPDIIITMVSGAFLVVVAIATLVFMLRAALNGSGAAVFTVGLFAIGLPITWFVLRAGRDE
jgi:succinate dehydrogenase hydrophobic anchor subunit